MENKDRAFRELLFEIGQSVITELYHFHLSDCAINNTVGWREKDCNCRGTLLDENSFNRLEKEVKNFILEGKVSN